MGPILSTTSKIPRQHNGYRVVRDVPDSFESLRSPTKREHNLWLRTVVLGSGTEADTIQATASELLEVTRVLANHHGTPDLGNKVDPVDELIYIILSRRTREDAYQRAYALLKERFASWAELLDAPPDEVEELVGVSGLGRKKATSIHGALIRLQEEFGSCTLEPTARWTDEEVAVFLCSLPEVGPKSAACVMMCSLGRAAFPVDAHVGRVLARLGVFERVGLYLEPQGHKDRQALLWDLVPPSLRYPLHVNAVAHGRSVCRAIGPRCGQCVVRSRCRQRGVAQTRLSGRPKT